MGFLKSIINPWSVIGDLSRNKRAHEAAMRKRELAQQMEAKMGRMLAERQKRLGMIDWQPALLSDSAPAYQRTPMKASMNYLASVIAGNSPNSANPWDPKGTQDAMNADYAATYGGSYQDQAKQDEADNESIHYEPKAPKPIDTSALEYKGEDVDGIQRPKRGGAGT